MKVIETGIDEIVEYLHKKGSCSLSKLSEKFGYPEEVIEEWANALEEHGAVEIDYSIRGMKIEIVEKESKEMAKKTMKDQKREEYVCDECGKGFRTEHGLLTHVGMKHKGDDNR